MITLTPGEAAALLRAEAALQRPGWHATPDIIEARDGLQDAVETFRGLATDRVHPSEVLGQEDMGSDDALARALRVAVERMGEWRQELGRLTESSDEERQAA